LAFVGQFDVDVRSGGALARQSEKRLNQSARFEKSEIAARSRGKE
jgi:hypothetical protein